MSTVVFLCGLGQPLSVWDPVIESLPPSLPGIAMPIELGKGFTFENRARQLRDQLADRHIDRPHLCGLSLGAMVALQFAADFPERIDRLVVSGGQVRAHRIPMWNEVSWTRFAPKRWVTTPEFAREDLLPPLRAIQRADLRGLLARVQAQTLVMCGGLDVVNRHAARVMAAGISRATLDIVPRVGHAWNRTHPTLFAHKVAAFLA